jgi:hypothetical protein
MVKNGWNCKDPPITKNGNILATNAAQTIKKIIK